MLKLKICPSIDTNIDVTLHIGSTEGAIVEGWGGPARTTRNRTKVDHQINFISREIPPTILGEMVIECSSLHTV